MGETFTDGHRPRNRGIAMSTPAGAQWRERGIAAARAGDKGQAQAALEQAVDLDPQDEQAWLWLSAVQQDPRRALAALERVLAINPRNERARTGLATLQAQLGPAPGAPPAFGSPGGAAPAPEGTLPPWASGATAPAAATPAVSTPPPWAGGAAAASAAPPAASTAPPWAGGTTPPPPAPAPDSGAAVSVEDLVELGMAAALAGRKDQAREALMAAVERDEQHEAAWYWLSTVVESDDDQEIALENVLVLNPDNGEARQALDRLQARRNPPPANPAPPTWNAPTATALPPFVDLPAAPEPAAAGYETRDGGALPPFVDSPAPPGPRPAMGTAPAARPGGRSLEPAPRLGSDPAAAPPAPGPPAPYAEEPEPVASMPTHAGPSSPGGRIKRPTIGGEESATTEMRRGDPALRESRGPVAAASNRVPIGYEELVGQVVGGRYRVLSLFSQGSSSLLLASDTRRNNMVLLRPDTIAASVARRGSAKPTFTQNGLAFFMSNISIGGLNLRNFVGMVGPLPGPQVVDYGQRLCAEAKKRGGLLRLRFWSPETVKIDDEGRIVVTTEPGSSEAEARPGPFSPPEHAPGGTLDGRSDVYLIGAILFFLTTGSPQPSPDRVPPPTPYHDPKGRAVRGMVEAEFRLHRHMHPLLAGVLAKALQGDPTARYGSVDELAAALKAAGAVLRGQEARDLPNPRAVPDRPAKDDVSGRVSPLRALLPLALVIGGLAALVLVVFFAASMLGGTPGGSLTPVPTLTAGLPLAVGEGGLTTPTPGGEFVPGTPVEAPTPEPVDPAAVFVPARADTLGRVTIAQVDSHRYPQVSVYVSVISPDERPVINMPRTSFLVVHNGRPVRDVAFSDMKTQAEPLSSYLVVDNSGSMLGEPLARAKQAVNAFLDHSQSGDFFGLFTFNNEVKLLRDLTVSPTQFRQRLDTVEASGTTALWDAVYTATIRVRNDSGRRALVLLSDGGDTASKDATGAAALEAARRSGVPIFVVGLESDDFDAGALQQIAGLSSGELWVAPQPEDLPGIYEKLAYRFTAQYKLTFTVDEEADEVARSLEVYTTLEDKTISGKREYYVSLK